MKRKPSPEELLAEVKGLKPASTYEFDEYLDVVNELKNKDHSYADIAEFLTEKLGIAVTRGQVYRAHMMWLEMQEEMERQEDEARRAREEQEKEEEEARRAQEEMEEPEFPEPPEVLDKDEVKRREMADDVVKFLIEKYPHDSFVGEYADILKLALAHMDFETRDELAAADEDNRLKARKSKSDDNAAKN